MGKSPKKKHRVTSPRLPVSSGCHGTDCSFALRRDDWWTMSQWGLVSFCSPTTTKTITPSSARPGWSAGKPLQIWQRNYSGFLPHDNGQILLCGLILLWNILFLKLWMILCNVTVALRIKGISFMPELYTKCHVM